MSTATKPLVLWGATGQAKVVAEFAPALGYNIAALFDNDPNVTSPLADVPLHHGRAGFERWRASAQSPAYFVVAVGGSRNADRLELMAMLQSAGLTAATLIHPTAFVAASAQIGEGSQILAHASVCADAVLGKGCIVNTGASVDHDCQLGDGVHVAPGGILCGCVRVGTCAFIGAGAVLIPRISVARDVVVAAGAVVIKDVLAGQTVGGVPAKTMDAAAPKAGSGQ
ncbi:MAG TPA: NeuD/PglB/VioB family sugar acetyltransferase [Candidatus Acidoferrales bacterium]|nr:NeuD/PglB/VioB family sugar acetyltransferase [Candidatus Acidoferrales bacterium]